MKRVSVVKFPTATQWMIMRPALRAVICCTTNGAEPSGEGAPSLTRMIASALYASAAPSACKVGVPPST